MNLSNSASGAFSGSVWLEFGGHAWEGLPCRCATDQGPPATHEAYRGEEQAKWARIQTEFFRCSDQPTLFIPRRDGDGMEAAHVLPCPNCVPEALKDFPLDNRLPRPKVPNVP